MQRETGKDLAREDFAQVLQYASALHALTREASLDDPLDPATRACIEETERLAEEGEEGLNRAQLRLWAEVHAQPEVAPLRHALADVLFTQGDLRQALRVLSEAAGRSRHAGTYLRAGIALLLLGRFADAARAFSVAQRLAPHAYVCELAKQAAVRLPALLREHRGRLAANEDQARQDLLTWPLRETVQLYFLCSDNNQPTGGVKVIYHHVDVLNRHGFRAAVVHGEPGFRCTWFANETRTVWTRDLTLQAQDLLVVPEAWGPAFVASCPRGVRKVIFNQNAYYTFLGYPVDRRVPETPYLDPEVVAGVVVSEDSRQYLAYVFPELPVFRVRWSLDPQLFAFSERKKRQLCFMPRKHADEAQQVLNLLRYRGVLEGYDVVVIDGLSHAEVAQVLRDSLVFLSFGYPEGYPAPPAEAMASGCIVIGYHGFGGREYLLPEYSFPVEHSDVLAFARTVEQVLQEYEQAPQRLDELRWRASAFILAELSPERELADVVQCWRQIALLPRRMPPTPAAAGHR